MPQRTVGAVVGWGRGAHRLFRTAGNLHRAGRAGWPIRVRRVRPVATPAWVAAVRAGEADAGCVPVENSVEGAVPATMDALGVGEPVVAVAEHVLQVQFTCSPRRTGLDEIRTVASHPHALAQVRDWLETNLPKATASPPAPLPPPRRRCWPASSTPPSAPRGRAALPAERAGHRARRR